MGRFVTIVGEPPPYIVTATDYAGTDDYFTASSNTTPNGKDGTILVFVRYDGGVASQRVWTIHDSGTPASFRLGRNGSNFPFVAIDSSAGAVNSLDLRSNSTVTNDGLWHSLLMSWNVTTGFGQFYQDDVAVTNLVSATNVNLRYGGAATTIAGTEGSPPSGDFNGCMCMAGFWTSAIDLSVTANRRKFITASNKPADLGTDGSVPFGSQARLFSRSGRWDTDETGSSFGSFTLQPGSTVGPCSNSPSD